MFNRSSHVLSLPAEPCPMADYLPLATLILPIVGAQIHGSIKDWQHLLLLGFILHYLLQVIRLPSLLLRLSSTSQLKPSSKSIPLSKSQSRLRSELKLIETLAFVTLLASPLIATGLLRLLQELTLDGGPSIDPFARRMCFIAVGLRPVGHLLKLFNNQKSTSSPRAPSKEFNDLGHQMKSRCLRIEAILSNLKSKTSVPLSRLESVQTSIQEPISSIRHLIKLNSPSSLPNQPGADTIRTISTENQLITIIQKLEDRLDSLLESLEEQFRKDEEKNQSWITSTGQALNRTGLIAQII
ncbi:hypothetical protein BY996DRAFT_1511274 [Phakopsora pachyrhizi]|nr:hypothetical protein BY996DRAFT_1511274 [Phakopsora pachyrhizi]